ncbi:unnamed protein product [Prunus armeniaca]
MEKQPVGRTAPLITNIMWRNLLFQALYQIAVLLILQFRGESIFNVTGQVNDTLRSRMCSKAFTGTDCLLGFWGCVMANWLDCQVYTCPGRTSLRNYQEVNSHIQKKYASIAWRPGQDVFERGAGFENPR